jgi:subtilisin family serine protease
MDGRPAWSSQAVRLVRLDVLMSLTLGSSAVGVGLMDGPVALDHPDFHGARIRWVGLSGASAANGDDLARDHGTFVAGILAARRGAEAPAICPGCTMLIRPIFAQAKVNGMPTASFEDLAAGIVECVDAGARVLNLSAATAAPTMRHESAVSDALDYAAARGVIVVAAVGNQGMLGSSVITRHAWVIPVMAFKDDGRPSAESNLAGSFGRRGVGAPGEAVTSLMANGGTASAGGTSVAAPFVTGAIALLWSLFPNVSPAAMRGALVATAPSRRRNVVPPLMDAAHAYETLTHAVTKGVLV